MLIVAGVLVALLLVPVLGGRLSRLAEVDLAGRWLVLYALSLQVLAISVVPHWPRPVLVALHASSYLLVGAFVLLNGHVRGLPTLALGAALNAFVIAVNGGQMPARAAAVQAAGLEPAADGFVNSGVVAEPRLLALGDVFATPSWLPLQNVYSLGDVLVLVGAVWLVHSACGSSLRAAGRPGQRSGAARDPALRLSPSAA